MPSRLLALAPSWPRLFRWPRGCALLALHCLRFVLCHLALQTGGTNALFVGRGVVSRTLERVYVLLSSFLVEILCRKHKKLASMGNDLIVPVFI